MLAFHLLLIGHLSEYWLCPHVRHSKLLKLATTKTFTKHFGNLPLALPEQCLNFNQFSDSKSGANNPFVPTCALRWLLAADETGFSLAAM